MVKKRELMLFLDKVENKAVKSVHSRYQELIDKEQGKVCRKNRGYIHCTGDFKGGCK